jgi:hypothetical protein
MNLSFDSIDSHVIKMWQFWSPMKANDVLPNVPTFKYLSNFEIISNVCMV